MAERLLDSMITKINQITTSLDGTIAQINQMSTAIQNMSQKFSEETISVNENIRLIVEVLKQLRMKSSENLQSISDDFNASIKELYEKKSIEAITEEEKKAIDMIRQAAKVVSNNLYYAQLLNIIQSIREETNRIMSCKEP
ncbi:MAG: hypothetical protein EAX91_15325 [Candidatus Lokiarchaeota archaeon]|nr:hypothetical protein [Candidatus Lokiarchaeota archaeon]